MSYAEHQAAAPTSAAVGILTVSDSRNLASDESGRLVEQRLSKAGHRVVERRVAPDSVFAIRRAARALLRADGVDALIVNGGTGPGPRDVTPEALRPWFVKEFPGFGEQFRALGRAEIGSGAFLSRATLGLVRSRGRLKPVFLLPGSPKACRLATDKLIAPELGHLVGIATGQGAHHA